MTVIVRIKTTGQRGAMVGTGFGAQYTGHDDRMYGNLVDRSRKQDKIALAAVALPDGRLTWAYTHDIEVLTIDGLPPAAAIGDEATDKQALEA